MAEEDALELGFLVFGGLTTTLVLFIVCFRLGLTVFDYFGVRHR